MLGRKSWERGIGATGDGWLDVRGRCVTGLDGRNEGSGGPREAEEAVVCARRA